jgi:hypothetical protein
MHLKIYPIKWEIDTAKVSNFHFWFWSRVCEVTTGNRLYYDRSRPHYKKDIRYLKEYKSVITIPAYIIPKRFGILWIY